MRRPMRDGKPRGDDASNTTGERHSRTRCSFVSYLVRQSLQYLVMRRIFSPVLRIAGTLIPWGLVPPLCYAVLPLFLLVRPRFPRLSGIVFASIAVGLVG